MRRRKRQCSAGLPCASDWALDVSLAPFFAAFGPSLALQILASALLEARVVLVASQYALLSTCAEAIRCLLQPFTWCHVYAPVLPAPLLSYLQCPTPILVGVHSAYAAQADDVAAARGLYVVADLDRTVVEFAGDQALGWRRWSLGASNNKGDECVLLPHAFEVAKQQLDALLRPEMLQCDRVGGDGSGTGGTAAAFPEAQVRDVCFELMSSLLAGHQHACLVVGDTDESVVIFDETQFLAQRAPQDAPFFRLLTRAQCFSEIVSAHRIDSLPVKRQSALPSDDDD